MILKESKALLVVFILLLLVVAIAKDSWSFVLNDYRAETSQIEKQKPDEKPNPSPVPDRVTIVNIKLINEKPVVLKIAVRHGKHNEKRLKGTPAGRLYDVIISRPRLVFKDMYHNLIYETEFDYPRTMTVPPAPPGSFDPDTPSVIELAEPEVTLVLPYFQETSIIEILHPDEPLPVTVDQPVSIDTPDSSSPTVPEPAISESGRFHILLMASGYTSSNMNSFTTAAQNMRDFILGKEPFVYYSPAIDVHIYNNLASIGCYTGCRGIDRLLCCNSGSVMNTAATSGYLYDEIIIIHNTNTYSGGSYREEGDAYKTNSANTYAMTYGYEYYKEVAVHEFGHSFGNLCDEYTYGSEGYQYITCVNCRASCNDWLPLSSACLLSCDARSDYYRPDNSIMKGLEYPYFNTVSIKAPYYPDGLEERLQYFADLQYGHIVCSPPSYDFGNIYVGNSLFKTFNVSNTSIGYLTIQTVTVTGATDFGRNTDNCSGQTMPPGARCMVQASFSPVSMGTKTATLTIISNDPDTPILQVPLSGTGIKHQLTVTKTGKGDGTVTSKPAGISCGTDCIETYLKTAKPQKVTLKAKPDAYSTFLGWGGDCQASGTKTKCTLKIDSDRNVTADFGLPDISVSPNSYDFGNIIIIQSPSPATFTINNNGTGNLKITKMKIVGTDTKMFKIKGGGKKTILPGGTYSFTVTFKPTSAGTKSAVLQILSNDPDSQTIDIALSGTGN